MKRFMIVLLLCTHATTNFGASGWCAKAVSIGATLLYWNWTISCPFEIGSSIYGKYLIENQGKKFRAEQENTGIRQSAYAYAHQELKKLGLENARVLPTVDLLRGNYALINDIAVIGTDFLTLDKVLRAPAKLHLKKQHLSNTLKSDIPDEERNKLCIELSKDIEVLEKRIADGDHVTRKFKGMLAHEANHIKHNDILIRFPVAAGVAAILPLMFGKVLQVAGKISAAGSWKAKLARGMLNGVVSYQIYNAASRSIEQQADDAIVDPEHVEGLAMHLTDFEHPHADQPVLKFIYDNVSTHPSLEPRIKKLNARLVSGE